MEISHPDRVVFPDDGITKGQVVAYYAHVADRLLPFIRGRALTVERFPRGIGAQGFMQKNVPDHYREDLIGRHQVPKEDGGTTVYPVVHSAEGIIYFANLGVITFHVPPVAIGDEAHPDWAIWDLDPPPGRVDLVREAAGRLRSFLDDLGIPTLLLASGSNGYHLRAPMQPTLTVGAVERLTRGTAVLAAAAESDLMTVAFRKSERGERVFVDWLRNTSHSTSVAPWSLRPRRRAPVAAPLLWEELWSVEPDGVPLRRVEERIDSDPWAHTTPKDLASAAQAVERSLSELGIQLEPFDRFRS
ncbi:MAG: ATP-dependent DNA ligase [Actinomycetota bacterium]|nr:ATP-dependent DNA ligase [Actinomycetota bacterium]